VEKKIQSLTTSHILKDRVNVLNRSTPLGEELIELSTQRLELLLGEQKLNEKKDKVIKELCDLYEQLKSGK
jgi:hypothetical protein